MGFGIILAVFILLVLVIYGLVMVQIASRFRGMPEFVPSENFTPSTSISVLIAARNEERALPACLESMMQLDYPNGLLEVIVIDDWSEDDTTGVVKGFKEKFPDKNIKLIELAKGDAGISGKKAAITQAIDQAKGELVVTTDADCEAPAGWLKNVAAFYETYHPSMIVGPVDFMEKSDWFSKMQNLEFLGLVASTGGSLAEGWPIMCNGANLAYKKEAFHKVDGFKGVDKLPSGDDVFLMLKLLKEYPRSVMFLKSKEAIVLTQPQENVKSFFNQRKRWLSKRPGYKSFAVIAIAMLVYLANLVCFLSFFMPFIYSRWTWLATLVVFLFKLAVDYLLLQGAAAWVGKKKLLWWAPVEEILVILYVTLMGVFGNNGRYTWRGRKIDPKKK